MLASESHEGFETKKGVGSSKSFDLTLAPRCSIKMSKDELNLSWEVLCRVDLT